MKYVILGNIVDVSKGRKHNLSELPNINSKRIIGINDLRNDTTINLTDDINGVEACEKDILIAWDGANAGTIGFGKKGFIGSTISRLRIKNTEKYNEIFLGKLLQSKFDYLRSSSTGATIPHINRAALDCIKVPQIELSVQLRIADVLTRAEKLIAKRKESISALDEFLKSTFLEMFGDPVRNDKGWGKLKFSEVANNENSKRVPIKQEDRDKREGIYPYYGATGIIDTIDDYKFDGVYLLIAEDGKNLLFRRKNNAFMASGKFWVNNHAHVLSFNGICDLRYLEFFLNNIDFKPYISGIDQVKLNKESLDRIPVPYPPIELQNKYASIVEKVEAMKVKYNESLVEMEKLYGGLSQRAFRGEL